MTSPERAQILSISSKKTMPLFSTDGDGFLDHLFLVEQLVAFLGQQDVRSFLRRSSCADLVRPPKALPSMSPKLTMPICAPGMPGMSKVGHAASAAAVSATSSSISLSLRLPSRSILRNFWRVSARGVVRPPGRPAPAPRRPVRPWRCTCLRRRSRIMVMAVSTRSRTICSTSRPT